MVSSSTSARQVSGQKTDSGYVLTMTIDGVAVVNATISFEVVVDHGNRDHLLTEIIKEFGRIADDYEKGTLYPPR